MTLDEIRQQYPQYADMTDQQLADSLYQKHYSDMERTAFDQKIGLAPANNVPASMQRYVGLEKFGAGLATGVDDFMRGAADTMSAGLADEAAAGMASLTGIGQQQGGDATYAGNLAAERARDEAASPWARIPGQLAGALISGTGLARGGATLMNMARPTVGGMALRGAGEGAAYGAAYGFGSGEGERDRLIGAGFGAAIGGLGGAAVGATGGLLNRPSQQITADALKTQASAAYQAADDAGVIIAPESLKGFAAGLQTRMAEEGIDATLHPRALAALSRLTSVDEPLTLKGMEILRRVARSAAASNDPSERRLATIIIEQMDNYVGGLGPDDIISGNVEAAVSALQSARNLWMRGSKTELVTNLIERANLRASQFSGSGVENALRTEFRQLAMNPSRMRMFTPEEQAAIRRVSEGGTMTNIIRVLGKLAPTGVISQVLGAVAGYAIGGPVGAVALPAAGFAARQGATAMTNQAANRAAALMAGGGPAARPPLTPLQQLLIRGGVAGAAIEGPRARALLDNP